jgi:hypothetical protein
MPTPRAAKRKQMLCPTCIASVVRQISLFTLFSDRAIPDIRPEPVGIATLGVIDDAFPAFRIDTA